MTKAHEVTNEDILYHISNSFEGWHDDEHELYFGAPRLHDDKLLINVDDADGDTKTFVLVVE